MIGIALLVACCPVGCGPCAAPEPPPPPYAPPYAPNVVLISLDALRADHLGVYGHEHAVTPNIDRIAAGGATFDEVIASATWTQPSVAAMLTGRWPADLAASPSGETTQSVHDEETTLAEILKAGGYATGAFVDNGTLAAQFGYGQGFDTYFNVYSDNGEAVTRPAIDWLAANSAGRFFCWLHLLDPHAPYRLRDYEPYAPADDPRRRETDVIRLPVQITQSIFAKLNRNYDSDIAFADRCVGLVLAELERLGVADKTLIVVTADHGESLGEVHGLERTFGHGEPPWEEQIRIPWIVRWPGVVTPGVRIGGQRSNVDIVPTLLSLLGVPIPGAVAGQDLRPALTGGQAPQPVPAYSQAFNKPNKPPEEMRLAIRTGQVKLFAGVDRQIKEHFRRAPEGDSYEIVRRMSLPPGEFERLSPLLFNYVDRYVSGPVNPDGEVLERLCEMGYLGEGCEK